MNALRKKRFLLWGRRLLIAVGVLFLIATGLNLYVVYTAKGFIFRHVEELPECDFALVLGTDATRSDGSVNSHFLNRTDIAAKACLSGKVKQLLISGNKDNRGFNEVLGMKNRILAQHVPETAILLDFGGTRTWESVRRANKFYHIQKVIVITDAFHAPRALFLCRHFGIEAIALCPEQEPFGLWSIRYSVREYFARLKLFLDMLIEPAGQS